jgi:hypothetical protein
VDPQAWTLIGFAVAGLALIVAGLGRLALEGKRLKTRVEAMLAVPPAIDVAAVTSDLARLSAALEQLTALALRAALALGRIRGQLGFLNRIVRGFPGPA